MLKITISDDFNLYRKHTFEFNEGVTCLIGKNGAGKTTLLNEIKRVLTDKKISVFNYDNVYSEKFANDSLLNTRGEINKLIRNVQGSEGQNIQYNFEDKIYQIGRYVKLCKDTEQKQVIILLDGLDSGISLDYAAKLKKELFSLIINDCKKSSIEPYIIISANNYEFCIGNDCVRVSDAKHFKFNNYDEFRKIYIK